ncbi:MAG TPA: glycosyltransferase family 4 protein [Anaerolineales bacterium]|nr:glycosyltransferase family 4 protein [Anaerolineales bacterium]
MLERSSPVRLVFSFGARFAGGGNGRVAYYAVRGLYKQQLVAQVLCGSYRETEITAKQIRALGWPSRAARRFAVSDRSGAVDFYYRVLYDRWAARRLPKCDIFFGWSGYCLETVRKAKGLGARTVLKAALAHPAFVNRLVRSELQRWGIAHPTPKIENFVRQEIAGADIIITPSEFVNDSMRAEGIPADNIITIPFGVDTRRFVPPDGRKNGPFRALFVGQVSIRKGAHLLLQAWLQTGWTDAELWILGKMKLPPDLATRYQGLPGLQFLGNVADLVPIYQAADVFILPSLAEGSALVTYEAMACGLPLIVTPNAGSVARDNEECLLVPAGDADAIAHSLERLRSDERLKLNIGSAARTRVEELTWEKYSSRVVEAMLGLVQSGVDSPMV